MALPAAMISVYKPLAQQYLLPMQQKRIAQALSNARHPAIAPRLPLGGLKARHFSRHKPPATPTLCRASPVPRTQDPEAPSQGAPQLPH
jgi:hypothetical protein